MSKMYTEKEKVLAERKAYECGVSRMYLSRSVPCSDEAESAMKAYIKRAAESYPLPKVTRPREVKDEFGLLWRWNDGQIEGFLWNTSLDRPTWQSCNSASVTAKRVRLWADLIANPTEEVEDDA